jgi:hypothetical protein
LFLLIIVCDFYDFFALEPLVHLLEDNEEGRYDEEQCDGTDDHTADDAHGQGTVTISTGTTRDGERNHTDNHTDNGHQNRAQTFLTGSEG